MIQWRLSLTFGAQKTLSSSAGRENRNDEVCSRWAWPQSSWCFRLTLVEGQHQSGQEFVAGFLDEAANDCRSPHIPSPFGAIAPAAG